jgi:hypothetical protein
MSKRILIATDLPFWEKSTGAQQRIASLVEQMTIAGFIVRTFYLGQSSNARLEKIKNLELDVQFYHSARPPKSFSKRIRWWIRAIGNRFLTDSKSKSETSNRSLTLSDFRWRWAIEGFSECVSEFQPTSVICEYVKTAFLLDGLSNDQRRQILCAIDTHDLQHVRAKQFREREAAHWLEINRDQETAALSKFDLIIAIQKSEADIFRTMAPDATVVTCGHSAAEPAVKKTNSRKSADESLAVGYLASANHANFDAIKHFLIEGWIPTRSKAANCRLVIAGAICESLERDDEIETLLKESNHRIDLLGQVDQLSDFYDQVDIVINPVRFGAGLKIKNCEAIDFGKPLITTSHGVAGMPETQRELTIVSDTPAETIDLIASWSNDRASLNRQTDLVLANRPDANSRKEIYQRLLGLLK